MIGRLKQIIEYYNLSASNFADKIDVPRSSISHLLSGRNKASLDFVIKVVDNFEDVELDWLIYGKGTFPKNTETPVISPPKKETYTLFSEEEKTEKVTNTKTFKKEIKLIKVILLYEDGSFDEYKT